MDKGSFIFYENNYVWTSFSAFQDMRIKGELTDLTVKTRNRRFFVHRVVLAARIPHFRKILTSQNTEISLCDIDSDVLDSLINFAYEGKLKVTLENVQSMLFAAVCLRLHKVKEACLEFHTKRFNSNAAINTINLIPSDVSIRDNFDEFCSSQEFLFLPYYSLKELIGRDDLKVANEEKVFEALIKWITVSPTERQHYLPYLLPRIRMNYLSPEYLIERVAAEMFITTSDRARQIVDDAKSYHLLKKRPMLRSFNSNARLYTDTHETASYCASSITTNQSDLKPRDLMRAPSGNILVSDQSNLGTIHFTDQKDLIFGESSNIPTSKVPDIKQKDNSSVSASHIITTNQCDLKTHDVSNFSFDNVLPINQNDLKPTDANNFPSNNVLSTNESDLTPNDTGDIPSSNILATNQKELMSNDASNFPPCNTVVANQNDLTPNNASSSSTMVVSSQSNLMSNGVSSFPKNAGSSSKRANSTRFKYGIYAVRSFINNGTSVSYYNHRTRKWNDFSFISHCESVLHVVSVGVKLYVFFPKSVETFYLATCKWDTVEELSISTEGSGVVSQGSKIYIFGGINDPNKVQCFDTEDNTWLQNQAMIMPCHSMSVLSSPKKFVLLTGGSNTSCLNTFFIFHTSTKQWTHMPSMITSRMNHNSAVARNKFYVCGGRNDNVQFLDTVEAYDTMSRQWNFVSHLSISRISHSLIYWKKKLFVLGGKTEREDCSHLVEIYDPSTADWVSALPEQPLAEETIPVNLKAIVIAPVK